MTRNEAVAFIKQVLGYRTSGDDQIVTNLQQQQIKLELSPTKPWFLLSELSIRPTVAEETRLPIPTDFLQEYEEGCLFYLDEDEELVKLKKDEYDVLQLNYKEEEPGPPQAYALTGGYFRLFPTPDDIYTIKMLYYKKAATLASGTGTNEWLTHVPELLCAKAGIIMAMSLRDYEAKKLFSEMVAENMMLLENQNEARKHDNFDMQIGGPH